MYVTIVSTISLCTYTEHVVTGLPYMIGLFRGFILLKMVNITLALFQPVAVVCQGARAQGKVNGIY
jgi:hypothetical protein